VLETAQLDLPMAANNQRLAQLSFERSDVSAHGGLNQALVACSGCEAPAACQCLVRSECR